MDLIINDEAVLNDRGWRLRNSGLDRTRYDKNPVLLYQHDTDQIVGHCTGLRIEGTQLIGTFDFDTDPVSQAIKEKATTGSLRGVSPGLYIRDMDFSPEGDSVTSWELLEVSLVTLPSNPHAVKLYSKTGDALSTEEEKKHIVQLKAQNQQNKINSIMDSTTTKSTTHLTLTPRTLSLLGLSDTATLTDIHDAITQLTAQRDQLQKQLDDIHTREGEQLVQRAIDEGKIALAAKEQFLQLYAQSPDLCRSVLDGITTTPQSLASRIQQASTHAHGRYDADFDTLDKQGLLPQLRAEDPDLFAEKYRKRFSSND